MTSLEYVKREWLTARLSDVQKITADSTNKPYISLECETIVDIICDALIEWDEAHIRKPVMR